MRRFGGSAGAAIAAATVAVALAASVAPATAAPAATATPDRYGLAGGCYALQPASGGFVQKAGAGYDDRGAAAAGSEAFRMQATTLGRYLLFGRDRDFLAAGEGDSVVVATDPGPAADWKVVEPGRVFDSKVRVFEIRNATTDRPLVRRADGTIAQGSPGQSDPTTQFVFTASGGCAAFPEISLNATGTPAGGKTPFTQAIGTTDMHNHVSAFEFLGGRAHCGKPWSPYGVAAALTDCPDHYPDGRGAILENLFYGNPSRAHDPVGWPTFKSWPAYDSLTHEQTYYRWIERAWMGGERLMVNNLVENGVLCRAYPYKQNSCNEMDAVRLQAKRMYELQDYIDAQAGGPGEGFFRIVTNPFQARRVINAGKLAVVLGIEESELFGCTEFQDAPQCTIGDVKRGIEEVKKLGVSSFYPIHKFDNAFGGTRFDGGPVGAAINGGQFSLSGHFWEAQTCTGEQSDNTIAGATPLPLAARSRALAGEPGDVIAGGLAGYARAAPSPPIYPPAPHCNVRGLTDLGRQLINLMVDNKLLVEVDHMSVAARNATLDILRRRGYSGALSGHEWSDKGSYKDILALGGMVGGRANDVEGFVSDYEKYSPMKSPKYFFGWGYGPDANGLGSLPEPSGDSKPVTYPFKSLRGDVTFDRQVSGERTYDVNTDGTAHYGLLPDWFEDLRLADGNGDLSRDMLRGSEAYLQTWERAYGVAPERCRPAKARFSRRGFGALRIRRPAFNVLKKGGQPSLRRGSTYRYCARGGGQMLVAFSKRGRAALVAGSGRAHRAGGVEVGDRAADLRGVASQVAPGLWVERHPPGSRRFVYGTKRGRVSFAGIASRPATHSVAKLKRYAKPLR